MIEVQHVNDILLDRIGEPIDSLAKVFPLSPSGIHEFFGQYSNGFGCTLQRYLGRCWNYKGYSPDYFLRGLIVDFACEEYITLFNEFGMEPNFQQQIEPAIRNKIDNVKWQYSFGRVKDIPEWIEDLVNLCFYVCSALDLEEHRIVQTQRKHYLYIGSDPDLFHANPFSFDWSEAERVHSNFVYGKSDFVLDDERGKTVLDLKCLSSAHKMKGIGKYTFQVKFYGSELLARGEDVDSIGLMLVHPKPPYELLNPPITEDFTVSDYFSTVRTARGVANVYRGISFENKPHVIPPKGMGACTSFNCEYWKCCPFGENSKSAQAEYRDRHSRWKDERFGV